METVFGRRKVVGSCGGGEVVGTDGVCVSVCVRPLFEESYE